MKRSLAFSILKCEYGWNGCCDSEEQALRVGEIIEAEIERGGCATCAAKAAAAFIQDECGRGKFGKRIDGKPNRRTVDNDRGVTLQ